jgi:hypothetical protein
MTKKERVAIMGQDIAKLTSKWIDEDIVMPKNERKLKRILAGAQIALEFLVPDDDEED